MIICKRDLYFFIENKLSDLGVNEEWYPLNPVDIVKLLPNLRLDYMYMKSVNVGAILVKDVESAICVNASKSKEDQRFDIAHELIHYWLHPEQNYFSFAIPSKAQEREKEVIANEGAAEIIIPYKDFIPRFLSMIRLAEENNESPEEIYYNLARYYKVNPIVIAYRVQNLSNEIEQFINGVFINEIVLSTSNIIFDRRKQLFINNEIFEQIKRKL